MLRWSSLRLESCAEVIQGSREIFEARGGSKRPVEEEAPTITFAYACVVTIKPVQAAETFMRDNIWMKRPSTGELLAERFEDVIEKVASHDLPADLQPKVAYVSGLEPSA